MSGPETGLADEFRILFYKVERPRETSFDPLAFWYVRIVPPQIYYEHIANYASYGEFYKTVFDLFPIQKEALAGVINPGLV